MINSYPFIYRMECYNLFIYIYIYIIYIYIHIAAMDQSILLTIAFHQWGKPVKEEFEHQIRNKKTLQGFS